MEQAKNKLVILVDMDDTIENMLDAWLEIVNEQYGYNVDREQILVWNVAAAYPGLTQEQVYDVILHDEFWEKVRPIPYAPEALKHFMDMGHELYLVTATPYESVVGKMEQVIFKYFPYISWDRVIITRNKQMLKADILIDDGFHNHQGGDYIKILVDAPYNRAFDSKAAGMRRVYDWREIEKIVDDIAEHGVESFVP